MSKEATNTIVSFNAKNKKALRAFSRRLIRSARANKDFSALANIVVEEKTYSYKVVVANSSTSYDDTKYFVNEVEFSKKDAYSAIFKDAKKVESEDDNSDDSE